MKRGTHGFTLVELIIVIAVIGVLAAILIPVFSNVIDKSNAKSALSDARNVTEQFISEYAVSETTLPDLLVFNVKGNKLYAFGYDMDGGSVIASKSNPYPYDNTKTIKEQADVIITSLRSANAITVNPNTDLTDRFDAATLRAFVQSYGFDPATLYVHASDLISPMVFGEATIITPGGETPSDPETRTLTVTPTVSVGTGPYGKNEFTFTIPTGTSADTVITLDMKDVTDYLISVGVALPGTFSGSNIKIIDESGNNFSISSIKYNSDALMAYSIKGQESSLTEAGKPSITKSKMFTAYMSDIGYGAVNTANVEKYITDYNDGALPKTFAEYLKEQYGDLSNITMQDVFSDSSAQSYGDFYVASVGDGLAAGNVVYGSDGNPLKHVETDVIKVLLDNLYDYTTCYSFLSGTAQSDWALYMDSVVRGRNNFWNYFLTGNGDWKTHFTSKGMNFYSLIDMVKRNNAPTGLNFTKSGNTTSGAILFSWNPGAPNAYQAMEIHGFPDMTVTMKAN